MNMTLSPKKRILLKVLLTYVGASLLISACGQSRDKQGIKVSGGQTTFRTEAEDYTKRISVGGESNPSVGEAIYLKDTINVESLRRIMAAGLSAGENTKLKNLANERFFGLTTIVKPSVSSANPKYVIRWLDDREGRKPYELELTYEPKVNSYLGTSNDIGFNLTCVAEAKSIDTEYCEVMKLLVSVGGAQIPYLVITRIADIEVKAVALPNNTKTKGEFIKMADKRERHHLVALFEDSKVAYVLNTVGVVNDVSRFSLALESAQLNASFRIWGDYARVDHASDERQKMSVSQLIQPYRSDLDISTSLEENGADHFVLALTYVDHSTAMPAAAVPAMISGRAMRPENVVGNILVRFGLR